ncbi:MAG: hypothetical protein EHM43_07630 [Ignavibacteriae bacterium]|nr:MAG: hypothetical protein EHM43_07630 [Ignavibacteriota bacterium]
MRTLLLCLLAATLFACSDDDDGDDDSNYPTGPSDSSTGIVSGDAILFDRHLRPVGYNQNVVVEYLNTEGKRFRAATNSTGVWELELPFGVYYFDTMYVDDYEMIRVGAYVNTQQPFSPIDWFGRGRRAVLTQTAFAPRELDSVVWVHNMTVTPTSAQNRLQLTINYTLSFGAFGYSIGNITFRTSNGKSYTTTAAHLEAPTMAGPTAYTATIDTDLPADTDLFGSTVTLTHTPVIRREQLYSLHDGLCGYASSTAVVKPTVHVVSF